MTDLARWHLPTVLNGRGVQQSADRHGRHLVQRPGLGLVRSTAINCGLIDKGTEGKAVWFEVALHDQ